MTPHSPRSAAPAREPALLPPGCRPALCWYCDRLRSASCAWHVWRRLAARQMRAYSEKMPPSPWSSAAIVKMMYLTSTARRETGPSGEGAGERGQTEGESGCAQAGRHGGTCGDTSSTNVHSAVP